MKVKKREREGERLLPVMLMVSDTKLEKADHPPPPASQSCYKLKAGYLTCKDLHLGYTIVPFVLVVTMPT